MDEQNDLSLSTATEQGPKRRRYLSAMDAVCELVELIAATESASSLDPERAAMASVDIGQASDPLADRVSEKMQLRRLVYDAWGECRAREVEVWGELRVFGASSRSIDGISHTEALRMAKKVDWQIEQQLADAGKLVSDPVDADEAHVDPEAVEWH